MVVISESLRGGVGWSASQHASSSGHRNSVGHCRQAKICYLSTENHMKERFKHLGFKYNSEEKGIKPM